MAASEERIGRLEDKVDMLEQRAIAWDASAEATRIHERILRGEGTSPDQGLLTYVALMKQELANIASSLDRFLTHQQNLQGWFTKLVIGVIVSEILLLGFALVYKGAGLRPDDVLPKSQIEAVPSGLR